MSIQFTHYPDSNRVPGVFVEMDPSQANTGGALQNTLLIGQKLGIGTAPVNVPVLVSGAAQVTALCGGQSFLGAMALRYLQRDTFGSLYLLPLADPTGGASATGTIAVTGPATASGTISLYVAGQRLQIGVAAGDTANIVATNINAAINNSETLPVSSTAPAAAVVVTALHSGVLGNDIILAQDYLGAAGGEYPVAGVVLTITPMAGGLGSPLLATGLGNLTSTPFDFIGLPYTDSVSLDAMKNFLADDVGRWSWSEMVYGGCFSAFRGTLGQCTAFGLTRNDQHMSVMAFNGSPDPCYIWTAEITAACAASLRVDPGLPLQYIATTLQAPPIQSQFALGERNTLLYDGMSTFRVASDNTVIIERMCTTYRQNAAGAIDDSYLDVETMYGLMFVARDLSNYLLTRYARKKLVSDTTPILYGSNCVSAPMIRASTISEYRALEAGGYVQNSATFAKNIQVENAGNGLVKILCPVDLVNQLRQIAILLQFLKS